MTKTMYNYTYIAADWEHDKDVVDLLYNWNKSRSSPINFKDAHDITQARDESLNCSIKASLYKRLKCSNKFILIVGEHTKLLQAGKCNYCDSYNPRNEHCARGHSMANKSFIDFECCKAVELGLDVLVIYKSNRVNIELCPDILTFNAFATHIPLYKTSFGGFSMSRKASSLNSLATITKQFNQDKIASFLNQ